MTSSNFEILNFENCFTYQVTYTIDHPDRYFAGLREGALREFNQSNHTLLSSLSRSVVKGVRQHYDASRFIQRKDQLIMEVIVPHKIYSILHSLSPSKQVLRVAMLLDASNFQRGYLLDHEEMACKIGLLCWYYPKRNASNAARLEASCCFGFSVDILLQTKED